MKFEIPHILVICNPKEDALFSLLQKLKITFDHKDNTEDGQKALFKEKYDIILLDTKILNEEEFFKGLENIKGLMLVCGFGPPQPTHPQNFDFYISRQELKNPDNLESILSSIIRITQKIKTQTELSGLLIHDIRSPMQSIISYLELLQNDVFGTLNDGQKQLLKNSIRLHDYILGLMQELGDAMMFENKALNLTKSKFKIKDLCHDVLQAVWIHADAKNIKISISISDEKRIIYADRNAINRVMTNILSNAIHFTPKDGIVSVTCRCSKENEEKQICKFEIKDSGDGINKKDLSLIFDKFYRLKKAQSAKGLGLGLYVARLFVEAHDGSIGAYNNREGCATFYFQILI